ncbi:oxysterol binding family protein [Heterostelium album PN500]|uniref:Oxysterol binding family protein n=1 Tax=Heterostelium pallidum (strain ATCC 26659 / Pp 5 / PN500) TaxID=670386 RepID=D3BG73_HETP5|nr:oxysterol binding family protein [Heterostelium album PN500]EFA79665.1 oxysterol binding family protein [Heterostelium album PN500]|eukprot:XP_020431786.1 oxysterol binding family protein [Heterostelium album PN500]
MWNYMKSLVGGDSNLQVEENGDNKGQTPDDQEQRKGLFKQLSSYVGKDITSMISLPVWIFEPVSFLQVMSEPLQYSALLDKAVASTSPYHRLAYLAAFNCGLYSTAIRTKKPFNPILGETFEVVQDGDNGFKFIAEQVSHHPPIGVSETTTSEYTLQLETELKSKFYGNSSEVEIAGTNHFILNKTGEHYTWGHLVTSCHNIIIGYMWLDHYGDLVIENHTTGDKCVLKFAKSGWLGAGRYTVSGEIMDSEEQVRYRLVGKWNENLVLYEVMSNGQNSPNGTTIWEASKEQITSKFNFPKWLEDNVIALTPEYEKILPATDSRMRTDRRALEAGDLDTAGKQKHILEEKQREDKKARVAANQEYETKYFNKVDDADHKYRWKFNGKYWEEREERIKAASSNLNLKI